MESSKNEPGVKWHWEYNVFKWNVSSLCDMCQGKKPQQNKLSLGFLNDTCSGCKQGSWNTQPRLFKPCQWLGSSDLAANSGLGGVIVPCQGSSREPGTGDATQAACRGTQCGTGLCLWPVNIPFTGKCGIHGGANTCPAVLNVFLWVTQRASNLCFVRGAHSFFGSLTETKLVYSSY